MKRRMVAAMGDEYLLGDTRTSSYDDLRLIQQSRPCCLILLDTLPACHTCWNAPYCGVRPITIHAR